MAASVPRGGCPDEQKPHRKFLCDGIGAFPQVVELATWFDLLLQVVINIYLVEDAHARLKYCGFILKPVQGSQDYLGCI